MARTVREAALATRSARLRAARFKQNLIGASSSRDCTSATGDARPAAPGLHAGATSTASIAKPKSAWRTICRMPLAAASSDFSQAQRAARGWCTNQQRLASGLALPSSGPYTAARAMADYIEDYRRRGGKSSDSIESLRQNILPELGNVLVVKLTTRRLLDWHGRIAERPRRWRSRPGAKAKLAAFDGKNPEAVRRRRATANRVLTYLKAALNHAWRSGAVPSDDAWRRVKPFKSVDAPLVRYLSRDEITRFLNGCQGAFRDLVQLALLGGALFGELCRLKVADYNPDVGTLTIREAKSGQVRHVTLTEEAPELLERLIAGRSPDEPLLRRDDGRPWKRAEQLRPTREVCARGSIAPAVGFHVLRHTHASILAMRGVPMAVIARQLGHADTRMTERYYAHLAPNYVADTIRANFPRLTASDARSRPDRPRTEDSKQP